MLSRFPMATVHDIAAYILARLSPMSAMKLQKLVYYAQAWMLVEWDEQLFEAPILAWAHGPVVYELFERHRGRFVVRSWDGDASQVQPHQRDMIDRVLARYGPLSAEDLSALTHSEQPWLQARGGLPDDTRGYRKISADAMRAFYGRMTDRP